MLDDEVNNILKKYFVFDRVFYLLEYDLDMIRLYQDLKLLRKDEYESNYRFIFVHYDTEYYITSQDKAGITLINLQKILESLDISNYFCLILTQQDLQPMCDFTKQEFASHNDCSIDVITSFLNKQTHPPIEDCQLGLNESLITKQYISLNGTGRFHRRMLMSLLKDRNLLDRGVVSYGGT